MEVNMKNGDFLQRSFGVRRCWWQMGFLIITSFLRIYWTIENTKKSSNFRQDYTYLFEHKLNAGETPKINSSFKNIFPESINKDILHSYLIEII